MRGSRRRQALALVVALASASAAPGAAARAEDGPVAGGAGAAPAPAPAVDATPEARALVERFGALLHGPGALAKEPVDLPLKAVVGGGGGAAAVAVDLRLAMEAGGRNLRVSGPITGARGRAGRTAERAARTSVELLLGGLLPFPWDRWKGSVDAAGVLHVELFEGERRYGGVEVTFDARGLPVTSWALAPAPEGGLRRVSNARIAWEPAGERYRLAGHVQKVDGRTVLECRFEWGSPADLLPSRWWIYMDDRVTWFRHTGPAPTIPDLPAVMSYFLSPDPERFVAEVRRAGNALLPPRRRGSDMGDLLAVHLGAILRADPDALESVAAVLAGAGEGPARTLIRAVAYADDGNVGATLDGLVPRLPPGAVVESVSLRRGLPRAAATAITVDDADVGGQELDRCWSYYFASGDPAAIRPVVALLGDLEGPTNARRALAGAARWSLISNARRIPSVRESIERDLAVAPADLRPAMEEILAEAAKPAPPAGSVAPSPPTEGPGAPEEPPEPR